MSKTILVDTFFKEDCAGHGGDHRTAQIAELVERACLKTTKLERKILATKLSRYLTGIRSAININTFRFIAKHQLNINRSFASIAYCGFQQQTYRKSLTQQVNSKLLLWEATKNYVAPYVAEEVGFKVIAMPHNLESLVPPEGTICERFETEVSALAKANAVFCIAREEAWLLQLKGVNAHYLPYYPPQLLLDRLANVREARLKTLKHRFLLIGNAGNAPTKVGMIEQLEWLKQVRKALEFQVDIVGYQTESLASYCNHADFYLHGAVKLETLHELMIQAKAVLIHQKSGACAITRIPEMLLAGIPVIANGTACRSAFGYTGLYCYDDWLELADLMSQEIEEVPSVLPRPVSAEKRFIDCLLALAE